MSQEYKVIKLKSGEELIAEVSDTNEQVIKLIKPMVFKTMVVADQNGFPKEGVFLKNWLSFGNQTETTIPSDFVATMLEPTTEVVTYYLSEKDRLNNSYVKSPVNEQPQPKENKKDLSEINDVAEYENMISDMFKNIFQDLDLDEEISKISKKKRKSPDKESIIHMNMMFSPEALAHMINEGMIDPRDIMDMIKHFELDEKKSKRKKPKNRESINHKKFTGDQKEREDFGNKWTDWNPDPDSDDYK